MSGAEVLKTVKWAGKYIPIVPVYGDEVDRRGRQAAFPLADPRCEVRAADVQLLAHHDHRVDRAGPEGAVHRG
jgi:hypothetical protein